MHGHRGVLIFAFNNEKLDYFKQANWVADRVQKFLGLPTTIVTDEKSAGPTKHNVQITEALPASTRNYGKDADNLTADWKNANRLQSYNVSPYEETIVLDSDYIVNSDQLSLLFDSPHDFLCHRDVYDVANKNSLVSDKTFGDTTFPHYWATVMFFRESQVAEDIFDIIEMVKDNWTFYSKLYKFRSNLFRNDYAVSIALTIVYGHRLDAIPSIPWNLPTAVTDIKPTQLDDNTFELTYEKYYRNKMRPMKTIINDQDFHCFNKVALEAMIDVRD